MSFEVADGPHLHGAAAALGHHEIENGGLGRHDLGSGDAAAERMRACCAVRSLDQLSIQLNQTNERTNGRGHQRCMKEDGHVLEAVVAFSISGGQRMSRGKLLIC